MEKKRKRSTQFDWKYGFNLSTCICFRPSGADPEIWRGSNSLEAELSSCLLVQKCTQVKKIKRKGVPTASSLPRFTNDNVSIRQF